MAKSLILLKHWDDARSKFEFRYWEEDFIGFVEDLRRRDAAGEIEWVEQEAGLHARDRLRLAPRRRSAEGIAEPVRLLRMHYKHNQIFTDHDIPPDAERISFKAKALSWAEIAQMLEAAQTIAIQATDEGNVS